MQTRNDFFVCKTEVNAEKAFHPAFAGYYSLFKYKENRERSYKTK
jgi:hypothetical protein